MGSRFSSQRSSSDSVMKFRLPFRSKSEKPIKGKVKPTSGDAPINQFGSKEELFFDSQPWLDSDCDDDFLSVNGDFTPSCGNTPVHENFSLETPRLSKAALEDKTPGSTSKASPTDKKKRLSELFQDSIRDDLDVDKNMTNGKMKVSSTLLDLPPKSPYSSASYLSGSYSMCSSERTPIGDSILGTEKPIRPMKCCLPSLVSCHSFRERRKKMTPATTKMKKPSMCNISNTTYIQKEAWILTLKSRILQVCTK